LQMIQCASVSLATRHSCKVVTLFNYKFKLKVSNCSNIVRHCDVTWCVGSFWLWRNALVVFTFSGQVSQLPMSTVAQDKSPAECDPNGVSIWHIKYGKAHEVQ